LLYTDAMPTDILKHALDAIKLAPKYLIAIAAVLAFLLFGPAELLQQIGAVDVAKNYRPWLGIGLLACVALLAVTIIQALYSHVALFMRNRTIERHMRERLHRLTEDEKQILRFYIGKQTRTNTLRHTDGIVQGLANERIIYRASNMGNLVEGFAYNIQEFAWDVLNEDMSLLNGTTDTYRTDKGHNW